MHTFNYQNAQFEYEPYPVCYIPNFLNDADYKALSESYPSLELFKHKPELGSKYSLAEKNHKKAYFDFLKANPVWKEFYERIKSKEFAEEIFHFLRDHNIDQNVRRFWMTRRMSKKQRGPLTRIINKRVIRNRFEFSMMSANGGNILPHSDDPRKLVTLVLSFVKPNEWDASWGGGTDMLKPKDPSWTFNQVNFQLPFEKMNVVKTFPFNPNQCLLFVKTYNSWHSVTPMHGPETALRKTITINIENVI